MAAFAGSHLNENDRFRNFLKTHQPAAVDQAVRVLNEAIAPRIDCLACGNCCKSLMIVVTEKEADTLADHFHQTRDEFDSAHLEKGSAGMMVMHTIPCHFLKGNNACSVYEKRFEGCREFPALHLPGFNARLFTTFMHYERCPIIFNVVEQLKEVMAFSRDEA